MNPHVYSIAVLVNITPLAVGTNKGGGNLVPFFVDRKLMLRGADLEADFTAPLQAAIFLVCGFHLATIRLTCLLHIGCAWL
jgi:hypothetical protein